jgi:hypothetical protein
METTVRTLDKRKILHICTRETIRPLRDRILTLQGFEVDSTINYDEGLSLFSIRPYDLVLIDVEGERGIAKAEHACSEIKTTQPHQTVAFVCRFRSRSARHRHSKSPFKLNAAYRGGQSSFGEIVVQQGDGVIVGVAEAVMSAG